MTSANVIEYRIEKNGKYVGHFRKNVLCKLPEYSDLLKYQPLQKHEITAYGYDENDEYWEGDVINLEKFLQKKIPKEIYREKEIKLFVTKGTEIYSDKFREKGYFIIDDVFLAANNSITDKSLVAVIKAHHKEKTIFRVTATSDKFTF